MKVVVDMDLCDANGTCVDVCPEVFELTDDDDLIVLTDSPSEDLRDKVRKAVSACPKAAITLDG